MPEQPGGTWGTVLIPWDTDDRIDERRLHRQLDVLTTAGLSGVYAHGTAGEFHELDDDEWDYINDIVVARSRDAYASDASVAPPTTSPMRSRSRCRIGCR